GLLDMACGVLRVCILLQVGDRDVGALPGVGNGHCPADATVATGDQGHLVGEATGSPVRLLTTVRSGRHQVLGARGLLRLGLRAHRPSSGRGGPSMILTTRAVPATGREYPPVERSRGASWPRMSPG